MVGWGWVGGWICLRISLTQPGYRWFAGALGLEKKLNVTELILRDFYILNKEIKGFLVHIHTGIAGVFFLACFGMAIWGLNFSTLTVLGYESQYIWISTVLAS